MSSVARSAFLGAACGASLGALAGIGASPCGSAILGGAGAVCGAVYGALYATTHHRAVDQIGTVAYGAVLGGMGGMVVATQTRNCTDGSDGGSWSPYWSYCAGIWRLRCPPLGSRSPHRRPGRCRLKRCP